MKRKEEELQKLNDTTMGNIVTTYQTENEAKSKFHTILAAAAISDVPVHTAVILTEEGHVIGRENFDHRPSTQPEE